MTGGYFWQEERDIPPGSGFEFFGMSHIIALVLIVAIFICVVFAFKKYNSKHRLILLRSIAVLLPVLELIKIGMLISCGRMDIGHLPLHLCSMAIYIYPVVAFLPEGKVREGLNEISVITLLPAAVSAVIFPDWTMYPIINFYSLHAFVWHSLQIIFPVLCVMNGWCVPRIKNLWKNTVFLVIGGLLVGLFDWRMSCNYWFLRHPVDGTPLEWLFDLFGPAGYILSLLVMATVVNVLAYAVCYGVKINSKEI